MAESFEWPDEAMETATRATKRVKGGTIVRLLAEDEVRHILTALAPIVQTRMAEAWDEGYGHAVAKHCEQNCNRTPRPNINPYRADETEDGT